ncbi:MAG: DnaJ domain-containing protein [Candidatus Nanoarchaeia archaeon]
MNSYSLKGHEISLKITKSGYNRKAVIFVNNIVNDLKKIGIQRDDVEIKIPSLANRNMPAVLEFWLDRHYCRYSYSMAKRFIDNLYLISKLIEIEVREVIDGKKDIQEFYSLFTESSKSVKSLESDLKDAKLLLELDENEQDVETINVAYKKLARKHHPDLGGSMEEFQQINKAHKLIKKEMGF